MKPLLVHAEAETELDEAIGYYEAQSPGLGLDLEAQVRIGLRRIQQQPQQYPLLQAHCFAQTPDRAFSLRDLLPGI